MHVLRALEMRIAGRSAARKRRDLRAELGLADLPDAPLDLLETAKTIRAHVRRPVTILDVGAHRGLFAEVICGAISTTGLVCFEPNVDLHSELLQRVQPHAGAVNGSIVGAAPGEGSLFVHADSAMSSVVPSDEAVISRHFPWDDPEPVRVDAVGTTSLDAYLASSGLTGPFLLKVDTQGSELDVLRGAEKVLSRTDVVLVEFMFLTAYERRFSFQELVAHMDSRSFTCEGALNLSRRNSGHVSAVDFLFVAKEGAIPE